MYLIRDWDEISNGFLIKFSNEALFEEAKGCFRYSLISHIEDEDPLFPVPLEPEEATGTKDASAS